MEILNSLKNKLNITVKYFLTPKEILILLFLICLSFISVIYLTLNLTNYFKVDRIIYTGKINEGMVGFPQISNPYQTLNQAEKNLAALLFSPLIKNIRIENNQVKFDLVLAEKIEITESNTNLKITLRDSVKFSSGEKITTADIAHTLQNLPTEKNWDEEIVDEKTIILKFKISKNTASFTDNLEILTSPIISKQENFSGTLNTDLITSGTYKLQKINKDADGNISSVNLRRFDNGEDKLPYLKHYNLYFYNDEAEGLADLQTKELNLLSGISGQIISKIKDDPSLKILNSKLSNNFALFLNQNKNTVLRDPEFRQVLSTAIDREQLVNQVLGGYAIPESNILGNNGKPVQSEELIKQIVSDKDNGLFFENGVLYTGQKTASGTKEKETVKISITTINNKELVDTANFVANSWKKLGLEVSIKTIDRGDLQSVVRERDFDTLLFGFSVKKMSDYESFFHSSERTFPKLNIANYASKKADQLLENLKSSKDFKEQAEIVASLSKVLETDVPIIILYKPQFIQAITGKVKAIMPEQVNKEEDKYTMKEHWFTETEKVLPWFETVEKLKSFTKNVDLWVN